MTKPSRIAFGSCNDQEDQNNLWPILASRQPEAFIWGGDAIYADFKGPKDWSSFPPMSTHECATPERLRRLYRKQQGIPGYTNLVQQNVTIFGTYDGTLGQLWRQCRFLTHFSFPRPRLRLQQCRSRVRVSTRELFGLCGLYSSTRRVRHAPARRGWARSVRCETV